MFKIEISINQSMDVADHTNVVTYRCKLQLIKANTIQ